MTYEHANYAAMFKHPRRFLFKDHRAISTDVVLLNLTETLFVHKSILKCHHCANAMKNCSSDRASRTM
jgi:hypothetical protein